MKLYKIQVQGDNIPPLLTNFTKMQKYLHSIHILQKKNDLFMFSFDTHLISTLSFDSPPYPL